MKKLFFSIILLAFGLSAFAQPQTKYANFIPAYPPVVGESSYNNLVFNHNGLYLHDIIMDSLPHYEIEHIPDQTVRFLEDGIGFYVKADSLHSNQVVYSYEVDVPPIGSFEFNATTGRFKFYPDAGDYLPFTVTFTATSGWNSLSQAVNFDIMPEVVPEETVIQSIGTMPSAQEYTIITETHWDTILNNLERTVYSYSISGKEIVLDDLFPNTNILYNMYELNLFAERLYIRSALAFPHTNVNIYARELIFEDNGSEIASINTTPLAIGTETNVTGMNGENAGNITLHIKNLKADYAKRFILNGAKGQNANFNGTPGNGGNGGVLAAPISIEGYCDFARGSAGVKKDTLNSVIGAGQAGTNGHFELITDHYSWMHPYYIAAVIRHLNDAYLNDYFSYTKSTANDYYNLINEFETSDEWEDLDGTLRVELQDQTLELQSLLYRLNEGLDYFGNPSGWAPMLSFEVYMDIFDDEIDRSMPTLYLNYWLQQVDQSLANKIEAARVAAEQTEDDIDAVQGQINSLTEDIPLLEARITVLNSQIEEAQTHLEQLQAELMRKAKHNVKKKNRLNKAFGIATGVLNCIPVYGQIASAALTIGGSYFDLADTYGYSGTLSSTFEGVIGQQTKEKMENTKKTVDTIVTNNPNLGQTGHQLKENYYKFKNIVGPLTKSIINLQQTFAKSSAPNDQVQAEFKKLCSQSVEFKKLETKINALQQSYTEIMAVYNQTMNDIFNLTSEVSNEMVTLDALRGDVFQGNSRRDLQAMQCVEKMKQRAMNRLVKYHYYMRKAYEYRLLRPYQGDFSLETMYNRIETLINQGQIIFDNSTPANITDYSALSAVFRNEVSNVIEDVINELTITAPEQTATIPIVISREILDRINANEEYNLNLFELGVFMPDEDNLRIVDFGVQYIEAHTVGNLGMSTYMNIDLKHNGISRFRKDGEVYWFNHISRTMENPNPHTWSIRYNPLSQQTTAIGPSFATESLLYSLLNGNAQNIMLFSRPAAWSDITMSKKVHSTGGADIVIDSLILTLQYDYTIRPNQIRYIDIAANENLMPYITCSEADRNGRSDGKGSFHRSYSRSGGSVTFTAMEKHGTYHFLNWTDRGGNVVSETTELTVRKLTDQFYRANYERWIPVINVADTIYVGGESGEYVVQIQNVGLGDIEMDWYVSDSLSSWVHVDGVPEGIDDGYFTFNYEAMRRDQDRRIDSLEILAPEIAGMSKMIYIVQDPTLLGVSASINPVNAGMVVGTGFFKEGDICTLTATANLGYAFINWTENGNVISSDSTLSFTVSCDRNLVANFSFIGIEGMLHGVFSVSNTTKVCFSQGNLQYQASTNTWRFAENQWDCLRLENANISSSYDGWIDLFGWGTSGYNHGAVCYQPWSSSTNNSDYYAYGGSTNNLYDQTGQADWGYNAISNGGNTQNQWRTLTRDEWSYLFFNRDTPSGIRFAKAIVNDVEGLLVLPDNWAPSYYSLDETNNISANYSANTITENDWASVLESHGVLFLPAGSYRGGTSVESYYNPFKGYYWASSYSNEMKAGYVEFNNTQLFVSHRWRDNGLSVRLVRTVQEGITQTTSLNQGWNWWSTNLDITLNDLKEALVEAVPGTNITIKSRTENTAFNPGTNQWRGTFTSFDVTQMYMIYVSANCEITLTGMPINPVEHPVTISNGANWIALPFRWNMNLMDAFAGFAVEGDKVKSRNNNTQYSGGSWRGQLTTLVPGQGYIFISNAQEDRTLIFGTNNSK